MIEGRCIESEGRWFMTNSLCKKGQILRATFCLEFLSFSLFCLFSKPFEDLLIFYVFSERLIDMVCELFSLFSEDHSLFGGLSLMRDAEYSSSDETGTLDIHYY